MLGFLFEKTSYSLENILSDNNKLTSFLNEFQKTMDDIFSSGGYYKEIMMFENKLFGDYSEIAARGKLEEFLRKYQASEVRDTMTFKQFVEEFDPRIKDEHCDSLIAASYSLEKKHTHKVAICIKKGDVFIVEHHEKKMYSIDFYNLKAIPGEQGLIDKITGYQKESVLSPENIKITLEKIFTHIEGRIVNCEYSNQQRRMVEDCNQGNSEALNSYQIKNLIDQIKL